jgi:hypothetical protein
MMPVLYGCTIPFDLGNETVVTYVFLKPKIRASVPVSIRAYSCELAAQDWGNSNITDISAGVTVILRNKPALSQRTHTYLSAFIPSCARIFLKLEDCIQNLMPQDHPQ